MSRPGAQPRGIARVAANPTNLKDYRNKWALIVGISDYGDARDSVWPSLKNSVNDACLVHRILTRDFGFRSTLLAKTEDVDRFLAQQPPTEEETLRSETRGNGSQAEIRDQLHELGKRVGPHDLFLFFYAGHGTGDGKFLVPFGAVEEKHETYLMIAAVLDSIQELSCLHTVLFFDCCFSGEAVRGFDKTEVEESQINNLPSTRIRLEELQFILSATGSSEVTPDRFQELGQSHSWSANSPFTHALTQTLLALQPGEGIHAQDLYSRVRDEVRRLVPDGIPLNDSPSSKRIPLQPAMNSRGSGVCLLVKPGLRIEVRSVIHVDLGQDATHSEPLRALGGTPPYRWSLEEGQPGVSIVKDQLQLDPAGLEPGSHTIRIVITDSEGSGASREFTLLCEEWGHTAPTIVTAKLDPCFLREDYHQFLEVEGGFPPFSWTAIGLPPGLRVHPKHGEILGRIGSLFDLECGDDPPRLVLEIRVRVEDARQRSANQRLHLVLINPEEYSEIPAGLCKIGYHGSLERSQQLAKNPEFPPEDQLREACPPAEVPMARFFIRTSPITRGEWRRFVAKHQISALPSWLAEEESTSEDLDFLPATELKYADIEAFLRYRGTRLPHHWEYEKAARGSDGRLFPWGDRWDPQRANGRELWWGDLTRVDQFAEGESPAGVRDLVGNAWELVRHYGHHQGRWSLFLRGGNCKSPPSQLLCFRPTPLKSQLVENPRTGAREPDPATTLDWCFRDVIEVEHEPPYPQGFVHVGRSWFRLTQGTTQNVVNTNQFFLSRYAVSNEEYLEFSRESGQPYPPRWQPGHEPFSPEERHLPVTGVTYEEAVLFCRWKTRELGSTRPVEEVTLPTLGQWRAAVHGPGIEGTGAPFLPRVYPWGQTYQPARCNAVESGWGGPLRVFDLPQGRSACGAYHLVGNVWEWVGPNRVAGGSWEESCEDRESWHRTHTEPSVRVGFRYCVRLLPSPSPQRRSSHEG